MGFWDYEVSSDEDVDVQEDTPSKKKQNLCIQPSPQATARKRHKPADKDWELVDMDSDEEEDVEINTKRQAIDIDLDEEEEEASPLKKRRCTSKSPAKAQPARKCKSPSKGKSPGKGNFVAKGKSPGKRRAAAKGKSPGKAASEQPVEEEDELQRIEAMRQKARDAFALDLEDDDDDDDEDVENSDLIIAPVPLRACKPVHRDKCPEEEDADIEEQLERERQEMLQKGRIATGGQGSQPETYVLKVTCKHGSVQIRQGKAENFVTLYEKFKKYAIQQKWAHASTKLRLTCDDEDVDIEENTPDDFDLEDGMTIDVVMK